VICLRNSLISQRDVRKTFIANYNQALSESGDESKAEHHAWDAAQQLKQDENGVWSKSKMTV